MVSQRSLPSRSNPLLQPEHTPSLEVLVERRRLGQTTLIVKPGQIGTSNATKMENLGVFDYAHLRAPLPKDLKGSGIFSGSRSSPMPDSYFLMRRSSDGFCSATGMFKVAFPWATKDEEDEEREYLKGLETADSQEVAGNIWVSPEDALDLAEEYKIRSWIIALLDSQTIWRTSTEDSTKHITGPPTFEMTSKKPLPDVINSGTASMRKRAMRSTSPAKHNLPAPTQNRPKATPRKPRAKKSSRLANGSEDAGSIEATPSVADTEADSVDELDGINQHADLKASVDEIDNAEYDDLPAHTVRVSVNSDVKNDGDFETTHTTLKIDMPADSDAITLPKDSDGLVAKAQEMVNAAAYLQGSETNVSRKGGSGGRKRKMDEVEAEDRALDEQEIMAIQDPDAGVEEAELQSLMPAVKRARVMVPAEEYRRVKVQKRALLAMSATLAVGVMIPFLNNIFVF